MPRRMPQIAKSILAAGLMLVVAIWAKPASAGIVVSVDWDVTLPGIQSTIAANPGNTVTANIVFEITGTSSISNYEMSTRFSSSRLLFVSRTDSGPLNLPINSPVNATFNTQNTMMSTPGLGVYGVNEGIAGSTLLGGPTSADPPFLVSSITFTVLPGADGLVLVPGIFPNGLDIFFSNANAVIPLNEFTFNGGSITAVPEPSAVALVSFALLVVGFQTYRNRQRHRD